VLLFSILEKSLFYGVLVLKTPFKLRLHPLHLPFPLREVERVDREHQQRAIDVGWVFVSLQVAVLGPAHLLHDHLQRAVVVRALSSVNAEVMELNLQSAVPFR